MIILGDGDLEPMVTVDLEKIRRTLWWVVTVLALSLWRMAEADVRAQREMLTTVASEWNYCVSTLEPKVEGVVNLYGSR